MKLFLLLFFFIGITSYTTNEKKVWDYCKKNGLTNEGAAGLMGNLYAYSRMESAMYEEVFHTKIGLTNEEYVNQVNSGEYTDFVYDGVGFGLALWTYYSRKQRLLDKCKGKIGDLECQLEYLFFELKSDFAKLLSILKSSNDIEACTIRVMTNFEIYTYNMKPIRIKYAKKYYNIFVENIDNK